MSPLAIATAPTGRIDLVRPHASTLAESLAAAEFAQRGGFSRLWVSEVAGFDAVALAARLRGDFPKLPMTVGPLPATLRSAPQLAMAAASFDKFGGDTEFVIGASSPAITEGWHGRVRGRVSSIEAILETYDRVMRGQSSDCDEKDARSHGFRLKLTDVRRVPLGLAALGPRMRSLAARRADRLVINFSTPEQAKKVVEQCRFEAESASRPTPPVTAWLHVAVNANESELEVCRRFLARYVRAPGYRENFAEMGFRDFITAVVNIRDFEDVVAAIPDALLDRVCATGNADEVVSRIRQFTDSGIHVAVSCPIPFSEGGKATVTKLSQALKSERTKSTFQPTAQFH